MDYLDTVISYIEGKVNFEEFYRIIQSDDAFACWINNNAPGFWFSYVTNVTKSDITINRVPYSIRSELKSWEEREPVGSINYKYELQTTMEVFLKEGFPELSVKPDDTIKEMYELSLAAIPEYIEGIEITKNGIIDGILNDCPSSGSKIEKIRFIKSRIREVFHLEDKKYPRWRQIPNWPVMHGKPMKYMKTTVKVPNEWYRHCFIDLETGEERVIDDMA